MEWIDFYNEINREIEKIYVHKDYYSRYPLFRGTSDNSYSLLPTLFRDLKPDIDLVEYERGLFLFFQAQSAIFYPNTLRNSWEILYEMRHHGLPTRLLDWTGSFAIALFFALREYNEEKTPCIWILNPAQINYNSVETYNVLSIANSDILDYQNNFFQEKRMFENPVVIFPIKNHSRLVAQNSFFTVHGNNRLPLNEIYPNYIKKINIPKEIIPEMQKFLKLINMNEYTVFPDLDGLCRHIKEHYNDYVS
jgi:hypothetical protein